MSESEIKKEKKHIKVNVWFLIFIVYLIFSLSYIFKLSSTITQMAKVEHDTKLEMQSLQTSNHELTAKLYKVNMNLDTIYSLLSETKSELDSVLSAEEEEPVVVEVTMGTYTGTAASVSGDDELVSMSLTLSENNMATLVENEATSEGTYVLAENVVIFKSNDGLVVYSFKALENGSLKLVSDNIDLTLDK